MRPSRTAASAGSASGFICTNHCVEIIGSTTVPRARALGQRERVRLGAAREPFFVERASSPRLRASLRSSPANGPPFSFIVPSRLKMVISLELVALAGREVVEVVRGRDLDGAGAELRIDEDRVGDDRDLADRRRGAASILPCRCM